jgi:hypothetical protein
MKVHMKRLRIELEKTGLLMLTDATLPSLTTTVARGPVKGSWWGHPQGNLMYNLSHELGEQPDVLALKLVNKKITFLQRRHWDALYVVGTSGQDWQTSKLLVTHKRLFEAVQSEDEIRADDPRLKMKASEVGKLASKLEERLLIHSESVHTDSGKHLRVMRSWKGLLYSKGHTPKVMTYATALAHFEDVTARLANIPGAKIQFPWQRSH